MSPQADYIVANGTGAAVRSDINGQLAAIVSNNSGATEPGTMYAYQWWADTTTGLLKQRNAANSAWVTIGTLASANLGLLPLAGGTMTGVLAVTAGTAALPGIAVSGDLNTGLVSPGADQLAITTGGTSRLAVSTTAVSSTLPVDVPLGAVGTPSLTFTGDLNTGLFSPGADTVALVTGGTNRVHVTSGGLVGIGSNSPQEVLDVNGRGRFQGSASSASSGAGLELAYVSASTKGQILSYNRGTSTYLETNIIGNPLTFNISGSEAARIDTSSRLLVGTSSGNANGGILQLSSGITFPATAVAASDANTLDDYEEGTWTPNVGGTATYSNQDGRYVKIGSIVHVTCRFTVNQIGTGNTSRLSGLPFPSANLGTVQAAYVSYYADIANSITWLSGYVENNAQTMQFTGNSTAATTIQSNGLVIFKNGANIVFSASYHSA